MAKTQATTTLSPLAFSYGEKILDKNCRSALEMLNWVYGRRPQVHLSQSCVFTRLPACNPAQVFFPRTATGTYHDIFSTVIWVSKDAHTLGFGATVYCHATPAPTVKVRWVFNGANHDTTHTTATNGVEQTVTSAISAVTEGWFTLVMQVATTATGATMTAATSAYLYAIRVQEHEVTSSFPVPTIT
jgi:hypothetical protein